MEINKKTLRNVFLVVAAGIVLYWILHDTERVTGAYNLLASILAPFVMGAAFAFVLNVPMRSIEGLLSKIKNNTLRRVLALLLTFVAVLLVLALVFWLLIPQVVKTAQSLIPALQRFLLDLESQTRLFLADNPEIMQWLQDNSDFKQFNWGELLKNAASMVGNSLSSIWSGTISAIGSAASVIVNIVIAVIFAIYCLFQKETLARQGRKLLYAFLPEKICDQTVRILRLTNSTFSNFLSGQCIEVCILGSLFAVSMAIFRMPYIPLVSVLVAVTAFIPVVGAFIGCIVGAFLMLVNDPMQALGFVAMFLILQQVENNLIYPRVVGNSIGLSGMWVLVAVAVGGELMGVAGMFLMIPFSSVLYTLLNEITHKRLNAKCVAGEKLTPQPPELRSRFKEMHKKRRAKIASRKEERSTKKNVSNDIDGNN